MKKCRTESV